MICSNFKNNFQTFNLVIISVQEEDGWIIIQRRVDASVSFEKSWDEYAAGFGDVDGNFWLGLEAIHEITEAQPMSLQIDVVPFNIPAVSIPYPYFHVGGAASEYLLNITSNTPGSDTLCNSFTRASGNKFSTIDRDNDDYIRDCASFFRAGWWFSSCFNLNLNGIYGGANATACEMRMFHLSDNDYEPIRTVTIKIRTTN